MHEQDFELIDRKDAGDGTVVFTVKIAAAGLTRRYVLDVASGNVRLDDEPLLVGGHDMTSIIGKRLREWLRSRGEVIQ